MGFFEWSDKLLTGDDKIDSQHRRLFFLANDFAENMSESAAERENVGARLDQLVEYTIYHFATEEGLMERNRFPGFETHKKAHDLLRNQVLDFQDKFKSKTADISIELMTFLENWLFDHIQNMDTKLAQFNSKKK